MKRFFSIIIVTWNGLHHLKKYLPSVVETDYPNFEVIIADNASTDGTADWVKDNYPDCKIATFKKNFGYAGGNNRAAKEAIGDVIIFLNNDAKPESNWLSSLNETLDESDADIVQPKIKSLNSPEHFEYAGAAGGYIDWLGYPFCKGRLFDKIEKDEGQYNKTDRIFWASGAAFTIKKELFFDLRGFDEQFRFHMEEIDLCWRALRNGNTICSSPNSVVYHLGAGSLSELSSEKTFYNYRNSLLMLTKNIEKNILIKLFLRLLLDGISGIRFMFMGSPKHTFAIVRAHFSFYSLFINSYKSRRELRKKDISSIPDYLMYPKLLLIEYFVFRKKTFSELDHPSNSK